MMAAGDERGSTSREFGIIALRFFLFPPAPNRINAYVHELQTQITAPTAASQE
jgi:hypothetical protein